MNQASSIDIQRFSPLSFWKMHGCGNDFVVFEIKDPGITDGELSALAVRLCNRNFGVGADGIIVSVPSDNENLMMRIFNADGSDGEMCVNGIRCFAKFYFDQGLLEKNAYTSGQMQIETTVGTVDVSVTFGAKDNLVDRAKVGLGQPDFEPEACGVSEDLTDDLLSVPINYQSMSKVDVQLVSMGNPHAISWLEAGTSVDDYPLNHVGPLVETSQMFQYRTNFEVAEIIDEKRVRARVWERGVGETLACGSGACAVMASARSRGLVSDIVEVEMPGGTLVIDWRSNDEITLEGAVTKVFDGCVDLGNGLLV
tara:strand:+ start:2009 stop:2941 length:933 start_codon:yes stop_codon:yes gene_type:complete